MARQMWTRMPRSAISYLIIISGLVLAVLPLILLPPIPGPITFAGDTVYPEQGEERESAIYINTAKDTLIRWLEGNPGPGLGARDEGTPLQPSGVPRKLKPQGGSTAV